MLIFAASDKGGTGRSVTSANLAYQRALSGDDVCYVDFDFGSPTAAVVFDVGDARQTTEERGLHSYLTGQVGEPARIDVWSETEHQVLRSPPPGCGRLVLMPGDTGGGEFAVTDDDLRLCVDLLMKLCFEFDLVVVDLSAGRSYAVDMVLQATAQPEMSGVTARWLVFHRWTRQHVAATASLVFGERGIVAGGVARGHDEEELRGAIRFVRVAVPDPESPLWSQVSPAQSAWMRKTDGDLTQLASTHGIGHSLVLGSVPLEPVLEWREQLITEEDVLGSRIANRETWQALSSLAGRLTDDRYWEQA
ncbi:MULTISPECIES: SCO2523 family variant P-loop protein [unclassified Streptomyces]|uniref:SCO2523 family variant P-loop protein n=1 Tax=unclassified Streptomyces TaxID=2593676 RepID=UPI0022589E5E|nr:MULTISPECIES: SCO2523 family variant P-loop protein [unclassified Streptomyces]MCX5048028.1 SCO2523 family variant P-loop protein [Streptomyces sp. NBC_00474]MCX5245878.1 SCO2523 family variant P-loop protein [Streptomyces sp. NBC_00201]MCX5288318.1 SCO2523 family variant P-loop protein [Streptomyces sp. NBC_00183]